MNGPYLAILLACTPISANEHPSQAVITRPPSLSARTLALLSLARDRRIDSPRRADAVVEIRQRGEVAAVPALLAMLPGDHGRLTMELILALGELGDRRALPALEGLDAAAKKAGIDLPGKIRLCQQIAFQRLRCVP